VLSDHGFAPFRRAFHLNRWLHDQSYLAFRPGAAISAELFRDVDCTRTRAYGLGVNGLYLNLAGRERMGIVPAGERAKLVAEIAGRLLAWWDPESGQTIVKRVYRSEEVYAATHRDLAPDLVIGYKRGVRVSNESALGEVGRETIEDNRKKWSGDHCMAADEVPGVLLSNRPIAAGEIGLVDLAPTILAEFGIAPRPEMVGRPILGPGG
jgi:predicted AlkP superfamily phosphohydrolase/phosphomutase